MVQEIIESRVEKRTKGVFVPIGGKKLLNFMDDFNMVPYRTRTPVKSYIASSNYIIVTSCAIHVASYLF